MTNKKSPNKGNVSQPSVNTQENGSLDPRAIQTLLEGIDLASRRGAYSIQEAGKFADAYTHTANVLTNISKAIQENNQNINGENS